MERRVDELKKEYDHAKEKMKAALVTPMVQTEVLMPPSSNGASTIIFENIDSTTSNKYVLFKFRSVYVCVV